MAELVIYIQENCSACKKMEGEHNVVANALEVYGIPVSEVVIGNVTDENGNTQILYPREEHAELMNAHANKTPSYILDILGSDGIWTSCILPICSRMQGNDKGRAFSNYIIDILNSLEG